MKTHVKLITGALCGVLNGLFGSGGGVVAVPLLEMSEVEPKKSHATSVAIIFFLSIASTVAYGLRGNLDLQTAWQYIPWGVVGAVIGSVMLKKVPNSLLRRIFGVVVCVSAVRLLFK